MDYRMYALCKRKILKVEYALLTTYTKNS